MRSGSTRQADNKLTEEQNRLVLDNIRLVHYIKHKFICPSKFHEDLEGVGMLSLVKAAIGFEPERGFQFSTYAGKVIRNDMCQWLRWRVRYDVKKIGVLFDRETCNRDREASDVAHHNNVRYYFKFLTEREKLIVQEHFYNGKNYFEIARELGITRERVRQVVEKIYNKLRYHLKAESWI